MHIKHQAVLELLKYYKLKISFIIFFFFYFFFFYFFYGFWNLNKKKKFFYKTVKNSIGQVILRDMSNN
ncbi:hypothetical protein DDB_G0289959 [Dictyostelium discoideum AX4]|uniref:Putative uncharacterized transmembrane protein DDB_G0289959 n=1 Tax=Dictyostelium discoideum TaxID=44689 RepID=Y6140_DICDI|nr:hypothetical protein DDB_G0289959 [Dictyostelium discoideum AX4]Q54GV3.1 RecName: Full=Putative uncharacterized transmembrane protein DDB_G0289959 [Dictyostelium discoideum]EAL62492.1 hypothetical protein DDB_G0289959 [Dictyostelium discoideum AX4]|eukprot:XP_635966.1 hypothetical protein DDB_G0289959 [Dictyostelium discoideum AX4]